MLVLMPVRMNPANWASSVVWRHSAEISARSTATARDAVGLLIYGHYRTKVAISERYESNFTATGRTQVIGGSRRGNRFARSMAGFAVFASGLVFWRKIPANAASKIPRAQASRSSG